MNDRFALRLDLLEGPITGGEQVTPDDNADLSEVSRGVYIGGAGDVAVIMKDGQTLTFAATSAGAVYPFRVRRVLSTGTTATDIVAIW